MSVNIRRIVRTPDNDQDVSLLNSFDYESIEFALMNYSDTEEFLLILEHILKHYHQLKHHVDIDAEKSLAHTLFLALTPALPLMAYRQVFFVLNHFIHLFSKFQSELTDLYSSIINLLKPSIFANDIEYRECALQLVAQISSISRNFAINIYKKYKFQFIQQNITQQNMDQSIMNQQKINSNNLENPTVIKCQCSSMKILRNITYSKEKFDQHFLMTFYDLFRYVFMNDIQLLFFDMVASIFYLVSKKEEFIPFLISQNINSTLLHISQVLKDNNRISFYILSIYIEFLHANISLSEEEMRYALYCLQSNQSVTNVALSVFALFFQKFPETTNFWCNFGLLKTLIELYSKFTYKEKVKCLLLISNILKYGSFENQILIIKSEIPEIILSLLPDSNSKTIQRILSILHQIIEIAQNNNELFSVISTFSDPIYLSLIEEIMKTDDEIAYLADNFLTFLQDTNSALDNQKL
ncbi:hypothetical protein TRFO_32655 [Tritrichomonas foetus]|uniref:Armadillo-type fold n=1 Tax=Tritrichomonas foetus TaxID=1144522 RepID=A0A1J4JSY2_9EUKA|nr:hypothetical protein TRFO_32655 [Tritrichomonas foetus]|eukprot:OHT00630.1 hypothetical protein TRFO_32655 [Tritrichomonas foetus]